MATIGDTLWTLQQGSITWRQKKIKKPIKTGSTSSDLTEQWKTYWAKKLIESYEEKEPEENENPETE